MVMFRCKHRRGGAVPCFLADIAEHYCDVRIRDGYDLKSRFVIFQVSNVFLPDLDLLAKNLGIFIRYSSAFFENYIISIQVAVF